MNIDTVGYTDLVLCTRECAVFYISCNDECCLHDVLWTFDHIVSLLVIDWWWWCVTIGGRW